MLKTPFPSFHYHPHQTEGIQWMIDREERGHYFAGGILADEMGLGKTWETIGLLLNNPVPNTLILVPPVLQGQWSDALAQSDIPHTILTGKSAFKTVKGGREGVSVMLVTYDRASRYAALLRDDHVFQRIIADEGHVFRNGPSTQRFRAIAEIPAESRWILSGTPVQNRKQDFYNLMKWLGASYDPKLQPLDVIADTVMLRRTVAEVREAVPAFPTFRPAHIIHAVTMPAGGDEKLIFDRLVRRFKAAVAGRMEQWMILELYLRIRQFLAHPQIYKDAMLKKYPPTVTATVTAAEPAEPAEPEPQQWSGTASKMECFSRFMTTSEPMPTLIFTTFKDEMKLAEEACKAAGYSTWRICGGVGATGIDAAVRKSREAVVEGKEAVAVLVQIQAGNAGINLQHLNRIVFLSSHWNPAVVDQAVGRSYRIGQTRAVEVHHVLLADGAEKNLDRHMAGLHLRKRAIARAICGKLVCDSAVDVRTIFDELNAVCPDEVKGRGDEVSDDANDDVVDDDVVGEVSDEVSDE